MRDNKVYPPNIQSLERAFFTHLMTLDSRVMMYHVDELNQTVARSLMPNERLIQRAKASLADDSNVVETNAGISPEIEDALMLELLRWFKAEFFSWFDAPKCPKCDTAMTNSGHVPPTLTEEHWDCSRVENFKCLACNTEDRFPRYNNPMKLLDTRKGRCGEWANCFLLCAMATGFECRFVHDATDHVWIEYFSRKQDRWIHCDPCENVADKPLLYESGWGKKLTYVISMSPEQVVDTTWRYSAKHGEVLARRLETREEFLIEFLEEINRQKQKNITPARKAELLERSITELAELICPRLSLKEGEGSGRESGELAWRQTRGEVGAAAGQRKESIAKKSQFVFRLSATNIRERRLRIGYNCAADSYSWFDVQADTEATKAGWKSCTYEVENMFRKEELDWKMVYLARLKSNENGRIMWKFDCADSGLRISGAWIRFTYHLVHGGTVTVKICSGERTTTITGQDLNDVSQVLNGQCGFSLSAELSGGEGERAWQHAQLFRTSLLDEVTLGFEIDLTFT